MAQSESAEGYTLVAQTNSPEQTKRCAAALAVLLEGSEVLALDGDLGAGKTHFTQGLAAGLGINRAVTSPTFNVLITYDEGRLPLYHFDLYRLEKPEDLEDIGFTEYIESDGVSCIEWASKFAQELPDERLDIYLEAKAAAGEEEIRNIRACAQGKHAEVLLAKWAESLNNMAESSAPEEKSETAESVGFGEASDKTSNQASDKTGIQQEKKSNFSQEDSFVLAFDTANEMISIALGKLDSTNKTFELVASKEVEAFRASNEKLIPEVDLLVSEQGITRAQLVCVVCGRGPGSFTGVRICLATAKGLAIGLGVPLYGVSTSDAQAWQFWDKGVRGNLLVLGDAMRKEIYPVRYVLTDKGIQRLNADTVIKAAALSDWVGVSSGSSVEEWFITGDALKKYADEVGELGKLTEQSSWYPQAKGLLLAAEKEWQEGTINPYDVSQGNPCALLPVYTRLSDAEEHERIRFAKDQDKNNLAQKDLITGVQGSGEAGSIRYQPLERCAVDAVADMESVVMGSDAWNSAQILDELSRADRTWWAAYEVTNTQKRAANPQEDRLVGYAGGWIVDGQVQILKIASDPAFRRKGVAKELIGRVALDARDLGAHEMTLEVRVSNTGAHAFYEKLGLKNIGKRPRYYSDKEDAFIFTGPLPIESHDVAGMDMRINAAVTPLRDTEEATPQENQVGASQLTDAQPADNFESSKQELILAIESSCDETAIALIDGEGTIISDVVASQIDFHSRFGGVVPEIASRKHIEAIGGVAEECLEQAKLRLNKDISWTDLSAVAVTYAPGLVGALVVGMAFAKGLAWSINVPLIGVNHLEGHLYANKIACPDIEPPMVVSLVSGGHTMLVHVKEWGSYETMGTTLDDAVGEAFDKVAKAMGLGYPGGPIISKLAETGNPKAVRFPRALMHSGDLQFSLSGLKTSVMTYLQKEQSAGREPNPSDVAASFQAAVVDVQVAKAKTALEQTGAKEFCLGGGVAANPVLRAAYEKMCAEMGVRVTMPPLSACTDNAAMIALVALDRFKQKKFFDLSCDVKAHAPLDEAY